MAYKCKSICAHANTRMYSSDKKTHTQIPNKEYCELIFSFKGVSSNSLLPSLKTTMFFQANPLPFYGNLLCPALSTQNQKISHSS